MQFTNYWHFYTHSCLGTKESLDMLKQRLRPKKQVGLSSYGNPPAAAGESIPPMLKADIILALPNIVIKPSLEEIQHELHWVCVLVACFLL